MCASFKEYEEVLETMPFYLSEYDVPCMVYKLSGAAGILVAEAIEQRN